MKDTALPGPALHHGHFVNKDTGEIREQRVFMGDFR